MLHQSGHSNPKQNGDKMAHMVCTPMILIKAQNGNQKRLKIKLKAL